MQNNSLSIQSSTRLLPKHSVAMPLRDERRNSDQNIHEHTSRALFSGLQTKAGPASKYKNQFFALDASIVPKSYRLHLFNEPGG
jgi:hypothetical protein